MTVRDQEIKEISRKTNEEITSLRNEKLSSEIKHKNKELATSTMHLIDKNELINSIKVHVNEILKKSDKKSIKVDLKRIIKDIDKNLTSDTHWHQFELHFDEVHGDFLKKIRMEYPNITPQEIKLCAYLKMNMSTKEIANLLKISVRGVEISRYRLRKKLEINKSENLVDFMMNF